MIQPAFDISSLLPTPAAPVPPPPPAPTPTQEPMDVMIEQYRHLRDEKEALAKRHAAEMEPVLSAMKELEAKLLDALNRLGTNSVRTDKGTAFVKTFTSYSIEDPAVFRAWVEEQNRPDFYENRVSKGALENWVSEGNPLPPGIKVSSSVTVNVRK